VRKRSPQWVFWILSGGGALAVLVTLGFVFGRVAVPLPQPAGAVPVHAPVELKRGGEWASNPLFREETLLRDPTPLFLPTRWNSSDAVLSPDQRREPGNSFRDYLPAFVYSETNLALQFPAIVVVPAHPVDSFAADNPDRPFIGFGQKDQPVTKLAKRTAFLHISAAGTGESVAANALEDAQPPGEGVWQPLEFMVATDAAGIVRPPVLTASSLVPAVDNYFQDYLVRTLHIGEHLPPGFYRVCIGP
jgi:hypothetical protein